MTPRLTVGPTFDQAQRSTLGPSRYYYTLFLNRSLTSVVFLGGSMLWIIYGTGETVCQLAMKNIKL